jgi:hypothetical protein
MTRANSHEQSGGARAVVLASVAVVVAAVALVVALTRDTGTNRSTAVTTTTMNTEQLCEAKVAAYTSAYQRLENQRAALWNEKNTFPGASPEIEFTSAEHFRPLPAGQEARFVALLHSLEDVQTRMFRLAKQRPKACP